ncbi:MAG: PilW family protein [Planctomycetota bacterium]|jgi:type II secretory pathway pseudopilin PulG
MHRPHRRSGFTLMEIMIATSIAMVLLFGALYSTSETLNVVREGDSQVHTNIQARRALDRMLKDIRYSSALVVSGDLGSGWTIQVTTTGSLDPGLVTYDWSPDTGILTVTSPTDAVTALEDLRVFNLTTETADIGGAMVTTRLTVEWVLGLQAGSEAGQVSMNQERTFTVAGSTWIRRNDVQ